MATITLVNPRKRRKAKRRSAPRKRRAVRRRRKSAARAVAAPRRRRRRAVRRGRAMRRYKRNPIGGLPTVSGTIGVVKTAATGAAGAIALDVVFGMLPLPDSLKVGPMSLVAKGVGAIGLGYGVGKLGGRALGAQVTEGALTILLYRVLKDQVAKFAPNLVMGEYVGGMGYLSPAMTMGALPNGFGAGDSSGFNLPVNAITGFGEYVAGMDDDAGDDPFGLNG